MVNVSIVITQTTEYKLGYQQGYMDGINKAFETHREQMQRAIDGQPNQIVIKVDPEHFEKIKGDFNVSTKNK